MASKNTVEIKFKAETEQFRAAIKSANSTMTALRGELKLNAAQMKNTGASVEALTRKKKLLEQQDETLQQKINALASQLEASNAAFGENSASSQKLTNQLNQAKAAQQNVRAAISQTSTEIEKQADAEQQAESAYTQLSNKINEQRSKLKQLQTAYADAVIAKGKDSTEAKELEGNIRELNSELRQNESKMRAAEDAAAELAREEDNLADSADRANDGFTVAKGVLSNLASDALSRVVQGAKDTAKEVVDLGKTFELSLSNVQALSGASADDMERLEAKSRELGGTTTFSAAQVADAFGYMALAGWDTEQSLDGINGVLTLAQAGSMDLASASDLLTDYLSAFSMQASDAATMTDVLAYAQGNANTNVEQLGAAFKNCAANCNAAGMDVQTTTAFISELSNQGLKGSEAGTALNAVMRDMTAKMSDGAIKIGNASVAVMDANGNYRDMVDIMRDVESATNGMGDAEKASALQSTFTADSIKGLNLILNAGTDELGSFRDELYNSNGAAQDMAATMTDNLAGDLSNLDSALEEVGLKLYDKFKEPLRESVQVISNDVVPAVGNLIDNFDQIAPAVAGGAAGIAAFAVGANIVPILGAVSGAVTALGGAVSFLLSPIGLVAIAIAAATAALVYLWNTNDSFRNTVMGIWQQICDTISQAVAQIQPVLDALSVFFTTGLLPALQSLVDGYIAGFGFIVSGAMAFASGLLQVITGGMAVVQGVIDTVLGVIVGIFTGNFTMALNGVQTILSGLSSIASGILNGLAGAISGILGSVVSVFSGQFNAITSIVGGALQGVVTFFSEKLGAAKSTVSGALNAISGFFSGCRLQLPHINLPHFSISGDFSIVPPRTPKISVEWYARGGILTRPTLFGFNGSNAMVGGEAGPEAVLPLSILRGFIEDTFERHAAASSTNNLQITVYADGDADEIANAVAYKVFGAIDQAMTANGR